MTGAAFWAGYDARLRGLPRTACPFALGTEKQAEWHDGWDEKPMSRWQNDKPAEISI